MVSGGKFFCRRREMALTRRARIRLMRLMAYSFPSPMASPTIKYEQMRQFVLKEDLSVTRLY